MTIRPQIKINTAPQLDIFSGAASRPDHKKQDKSKRSGKKTDKRRFVAPDPNAIPLGNTRLKEHLEVTGQKTPFIIASLLDEQDWSDFEQRYAPEGRPPYSPRNMMDLIFYGIMQGITSLRTLEQLARVDLGCMWVTGGILKQEAIQQAYKAAQKQVDNHPDCPESKKNLEMASSAFEAVVERKEKRKKNGKSGRAVVSPTEPEAVVQKMKQGRGYTTGYKPSH